MGPGPSTTTTTTTTTPVPFSSSMAPINHNSHPPQQSFSSSSKATMSSAARYAYNLKAIRKRDPTIISIFDTLPHVCVYHHEGGKWLKHGFEGSMFLFERTVYPPYGLYVMNRMGMEDYIHAICPEDDVICKGQFLIVRSYPNFYQARISKIQPEGHDCFSPAYLIPNIDQLDGKQKGPSNIIGLWTHEEFVERMANVMTRLHSYVKRNLPYPNEYRNFPATPPPDANGMLTGLTSGQETDNEQDFSDAPSAYSGEMSDLDKLFSRIKPAATPATPSSASTKATTQSMTLESLFASAATPSLPVSTSTSAVAPPTTGIRILDSIFQSARVEDQKPPIFAPQPSTNPPQVLNQEVISGLLGLPPSRAPSVASTTLSVGAVSHHSSREGDNEDSSDDYEGGSAARQQMINSFAGLPIRNTLNGRINGDVTPRPPLPVNPSSRVPQLELPSSIEAASSISTVRGTQAAVQPPRPNRDLVPFAPDSELWPYSKQTPRQRAASDDDEEIVELNFEETSVLSNPVAFRQAALQRKKSAISLADASSASVASKEKGKRAKKTRKERNARAQEEIEKGWDIPPPSPSSAGAPHDFHSRVSSPSPPPGHQEHSSNHVPPASEMKTPTLTAKASLSANGIHHFSPPQLKLVNGKNKARTNGYRGEQEIATEALLSMAPSHPALQGVTTQVDFSQGLLNLITSDPTFVDSLWKDFVARRGF